MVHARAEPPGSPSAGIERVTHLHTLPSLILVAALCLAGTYARAAAQPTPDDWLIVDCLLPGQVRQLGTRVTYLSARRAVKTSARDCAIRGGEFVRHDAADYRSALAVWLPAAEEGDVEAQINVGTIYERGLGRAPDFAQAAEWYRRAADAGALEAQLKLAALYETGRGVPLDLQEARRWFQRASGGQAPVLQPLPAAPDPALLAAVDTLGNELDRLRAENATLRAELEAARSLLETRTSDADQRAAERVHRMTVDLSAQDARIGTLERQLQTARSALATAQQTADADAAAFAERHAQAEAAARDAERRFVAASQDASELSARLAEREQLLAAEARRTGELEARLREIEARTDGLRTARALEQTARDAGALAPPQLTLIDPAVPATRGLVKVSAPVAADVRRVVGRVTAPAGLLSLTVDGAPAEPNEAGVFASDVQMTGSTPVAIVAIDALGNRTALELVQVVAEAADAAAAPAGSDGWRDLRFGRYHALVIGNDRYAHMPALNSAVADSVAITRVLETRYGFDVIRLENATRYEILSALNTLRESLTSEDNLLIYYAGHGELDRVNMRGHWLPVDAEPGNTANWISNVSITDILNASAARQVLLLADSCYAGSLTRAGLTDLKVARTDAEQTNWVRTMLERRSRLALTSGGLAPVLDAGGGAHSVFAGALLEVLETNTSLLESADLYEQVAARVAYRAANLRFEQVPEFAPIRHAGHEAGEFFLVPRS